MTTSPSLPSPSLLLLPPLLLLLLASSPAPSEARDPRDGDLLNAHHAPLSALTAPRSHYFLEFPVEDHDDAAAAAAANNATASSSSRPRPRCEDGSPYSFLFRRGTDEHLNKLLVEFGGASDSGRYGTSAPWDALRSFDGRGLGVPFPPLGSCTGISEGFLTLGAGLAGFGGGASGGEEDVPIFLRGHPDAVAAGDDRSASAAADDGDSDGNIFQQSNNRDFVEDKQQYQYQQEQRQKKNKAWWEYLSGEHSSVGDWSYLFVPHCTPSRPSLTNENVLAVTKWIGTQFSARKGGRGLDALTTVSGGGRIGGCAPPTLFRPPPDGRAGSGGVDPLAALSFARNVAAMSFGSALSRALVIADGSALQLGTKTSELVREALSSGGVEVAWVASAAASEDGSGMEREEENDDEVELWRGMTPSQRASFHVHRPVADDGTKDSLCPRYAFSDASADDAFVGFLRDVVGGMPWGGVGADEVQTKEHDGYDDDGGRLSFLTIFLILFGGYVLSWAVYLPIKYVRRRRSKDAFTPSPHDLWFLALTKFPVLFLLVSILIPVVLSYVAYERTGVNVNLDFDSYLDIDTLEERTAMQYKALVDNQKGSLKEEEGNCEGLYSGNFTDRDPERRKRTLLEEVDEWDDMSEASSRGRRLQEYGKRNGRTVISFFYQNRKGGTVFTPEVLGSIREFEKFLMNDVEGFDKLCYGDDEICYPFNSIAPYFYPDGENLVDDIDGVLKSFPGSKIALAKMDKYFSKKNLGSNVTLTNVMLNDVNGRDRAKVHAFLESLHRELWALDQAQKYPDLIISWSNSHMQNVEAADALEHDFKWSLAALCFIGLMVFVKVRNVFEVLAGVLGLVLSFTSALYWQYHFDFDQLTAMHVAGIFVMLGIGADDIFLTIDSFEHTKVDFTSRILEEQAEDDGEGSGEVPNLDDPEIIKQRMVSSYKTAGSMLLVSSVTTAICFFSNIFSALVAIADFGSYMGMVVVLNYIHVMTILPSAIIVYEVHIKPLQQKMWRAVCCRSKTSGGEDTVESGTAEVVDAETGVVQFVSTQEGSNDEDGEGGDKLAATGETLTSSQHEGLRDDLYTSGGAETGVTASYSQPDDDWHENGCCRRGVATPETTASASEASFHQNDPRQAPNDYKFLDHVGEMTALDRYFVRRHAPFVYQWRITIVFTSLFVAIILGVLAWLNFTLYDGTIIVFKEQYNLGRVQRVIDAYFPEGVVRKYTDEGVDFVGNNDDVSVTGEDLDNSFGGSGVLDVLSDVDGAARPPPTTRAPTRRPSTSAPTSRPSPSPTPAPSGSQEQNTTGIAPTLPPIDGPASPYLPVGPTSPPEEWYPNWTGDTRGCLNDGLQPSYMNDLLFDSKVECCDEYFALDSNPGNCLEIDIYIDVFKCDGTDFNRDSSEIAPNAPFFVCIMSKSSNVDIDYLNSMVIAQGDSDLTLINYDAILFPSFTSREFVEARSGFVVSTHVPVNVFNYNAVGASIKVTGGVVVKANLGDRLDASEEASFELNINLRQNVAPQVTSPNQIPSVPGPAVPGPTVPGSTVPGPTVPGPAVPGPTVTSPSTPQSNVSAPPPSPWYPDWNARVCLRDGRHPEYMNDSPGTFLFDKLVECCDKNFAGDQSLCLGIDGTTTAPTTVRPTTSPSKNPTLSPTATTSPTLLPTAASLPPTDTITPQPTHQPTNSPTFRPSSKPTASPIKEETKFNCPPGLSGKYCLQTSGVKKTYKKREYYAVSIVWGMMPIHSDPNIFVIRDSASKNKNQALEGTLNSNYIDPSEEYIQEWLLELVTLARNDTALRIHPQLVWIEALRDFAVENGIGFPIPKGLFIGLIEMLKARSSFFEKLVEREIATKNPGIAGEFLFTGLSVLSEVPAAYTSGLALNEWTNFTSSVNRILPNDLPPINAQSDVFMDSLRTTAIVDSTLSSYFFANGFYVVIILLFTGNFLLTLMVMLSLLLILLAFAGLTFFAFRIEFGPVESLGVSIFVGLSANYLLHISHSYHKSNIKEHDVKIQRAVFVTGSPILWSALSTIGGSVFLFACRTWLLTELGILICTIISLSLICSVGFLLALLAFIGPLPIAPDGNTRHNLHSCDLMTVFNKCGLHKHVRRADSESNLTTAPVEAAEGDAERSWGEEDSVSDEMAPVEIAERDAERLWCEEGSISGATAASF